jgi:hypothetical protein
MYCTVQLQALASVLLLLLLMCYFLCINSLIELNIMYTSGIRTCAASGVCWTWVHYSASGAATVTLWGSHTRQVLPVQCTMYYYMHCSLVHCKPPSIVDIIIIFIIISIVITIIIMIDYNHYRKHPLSHPLACNCFILSGPCITLQSEPGTSTNTFFHVQYSAYSEVISGTCLTQHNPQQQGNFVAFISPPTTFSQSQIVGRDMVSYWSVMSHATL